ncbi:hypothetical protein [Denitratisoma sp. agr-D3]
MVDIENEQIAYKNKLALKKYGGVIPAGGVPIPNSRLQLGPSGPRASQEDHFSFKGFTESNDKRHQTFSAFNQNEKGSQFAFGSKTLGKDGNIKQGFGFMASQDEHGSSFKMTSFGKGHQFSMDITSSGGHSGFAMEMQNGKGGFSMNLGFQGKQGPGLALQSGKNGLSMMLDLTGGKGNKGMPGGGMNMSINMGGKGGIGMNLKMGGGNVSIGMGKGGLSLSIGSGSSGPKTSGK